MTNRKFYKTTITLEVLSEEPIPNWMDTQAIVYEAQEGGFSMATVGNVEVELDGKQAANELTSQGSEPEFFGLTEDGEDVKDEE